MYQLPTPAKDPSGGIVAAGTNPEMTPKPAGGGGSAPDAAGMIRAFRRRWPLAVGGGAVLALLTAVLAWLVVSPAKYTAVATLHVRMVRPMIIFKTAEQEAEYTTYQKTQVALLKSRLVLNKVVSDAAVANLDTLKELPKQAEPADWLDSQLVVDFANRSEILHVALSGDHPDDLAVIVNKVVQYYMREVVDLDVSDRNDRVETLRGLRSNYSEDLKSKREQFRKTALVAGSDDKQTLSIKGQLAYEQLAMAEAERMRNRGELTRLKVRAKLLEADRDATAKRPAAEAAESVPDHVLDEYLATDDYGSKLKDYIEKCIARHDLVHRTVRNRSDPALREARNQIDGARKKLAAYRERIRPVVARKLSGSAADPARELDQVRLNAAVYEQLDKDLAKDIERMRAEIKALNENTLDLETEKEAIATLAETTKKVGAEVDAMEVEIKAPKRIRVVDEAKAPRARDELKKLKVSGTAAMGAFAFVLVGVTFWEARAKRVNSPEEVVKGLGIRLVGSLPAQNTATRRRPAAGLPGPSKWQSVLVESVDATRTMLLHASRVDSLQIVMVSSAVEGEGKTTLSCHLTASLARAGRRTLLIDCDLRRPSAHRLFDLPAGPGVSELLRGEVELADVVRPTHAPDLHMIPAGHCDALAVQALSQGGLESVFDALRTRYDFIVVDSAPVLPVVDSLIVGQHVDAVIFSVMRDISRIPMVQEARDRLSSLGVRILGAVVSGMPGEFYGARYNYKDPEAPAEPAAESASPV